MESRPTPPGIRLLSLTDADYAAFVENQIAETARQHVNAREWAPDEAVSLARERLSDLIADRLRGPASGHQFLQGVTMDGSRVGWLWVSPVPSFLDLGPGHERTCWLSQITVQESMRGQGFGRLLLTALHARLRSEGARQVWLRVYDWNVVAQRLYLSFGYELARKFETDAHFRKVLRAESWNVL